MIPFPLFAFLCAHVRELPDEVSINSPDSDLQQSPTFSCRRVSDVGIGAPILLIQPFVLFALYSQAKAHADKSLIL